MLSISEIKKIDNIQKIKNIWKKFQFSKYMSEIFIKYIFFRIDWIYKWENQKKNNLFSKEDIWQKKLWIHIINQKNKKKNNNISSLITHSLNYFKKKNPSKKKRIFIFISNNINPFYNLYIFMIQKIKSIYLFKYIIDKKNINKIILYNPPFYKKKISIKDKDKIENKKLLHKKSFLLEKINFIFKNQKKKIYNIFKKFNNKDTLNILKNDIFNSKYPNKKKKKLIKNHSILICKCLTLRQEVEKLYIHLNKMLNKDHSLKPNDILITAYNIKPYLTYIKNIFPKTKKNKNLLTISRKYDNNFYYIIKTIENLFKIEKYQLKYTWILSLLDSSFIRKKFSIKKEDLKKIIKWIIKLKVKWAYNKNHLKQMSIPNIEIYTWDYAIKRIILGCFFEEIHKNKNKIPPYCVTSKENQIILGNFIDFINCLKKFKKKIKNKKLLKNWLPIIKDTIKIFFDIPKKYENFFLSLEETWKKIILQTMKSNYPKRIPIELLIQEFLEKKKIFLNNSNFMSGLVNIENIINIDMIPFKIIYILGCTILEKKKKINQKLNLIDKFPCLEDNYYKKTPQNIYLKTIMFAKKYLFLSYSIEKENKNQEKCSIFINTLKLYLKNNFKNLEKKDNEYFKDYTKIYIIKNFFEILNIENSHKKIPKNKKNIPKYTKKNSNKIILPFKRYIYINELIKFWKNPIHYFFKKTLKINITYEHFNNISTNEPFSIDPIEKYNINFKILDYLLKKKDTKKLFYELYQKGYLPYNNIGKILWNEQKKKIKKLAKKIENKRSNPKKIKIKLKIDSYYLKGTLSEINDYGLLDWTPTKIYYMHEMQLWIKYLIYSVIGEKKKNIMLGIDNDFIKFSKINRKTAYEYLKKYIQGYLTGIRKPIFLLKSGIIQLNETHKKKNKKINEQTEKKFFDTWQGNSFYKGEKEDIYVQKIIPSLNIKNKKKIFNTCKFWWNPILKYKK